MGSTRELAWQFRRRIPRHDGAIRQPAGGYTLVLGQSPNYTMNVHFQNAPYAIDDIVFLNLSQKDNPIFYVNKDAPWANLVDLIADAKNRPGEI